MDPSHTSASGGNCRLERTGRRIDKTESPPSEFCKLHYDSASVMLRGRVINAHCGGHGVEHALIELRELDPDTLTKIRLTSSDPSGRYVVGALEGDKRYALGVTRGKEFETYTDTLTFRPGEQATYDVELRRECDG